jgi:hypothetical protein
MCFPPFSITWRNVKCKNRMTSKRKIITTIPASSCCKAWHSPWCSHHVHHVIFDSGHVLLVGFYVHFLKYPPAYFSLLVVQFGVQHIWSQLHSWAWYTCSLHQSHFLMQHLFFPHAISFSKFLETCPSKCPGIQEISCWVIDSLSCGPWQSIPTLHMRWAREESPTQCLEEETTNRDNNSLIQKMCNKKRVGSTLIWVQLFD